MNGYRSPWLDSDTELLADTAAKFVSTEVVPHLDRFDRQQRPDRELWTRAGGLGLLCCSVPTRYGGGGGTFAHDLAVFTEHARAGDTGFGTGNAVHSGVVAHYVLAYGTEEQRRKWLPRMASGELIGTIAMTEPGAGSDLVSGRGESHPPALSGPDVTVSRHPAPTDRPSVLAMRCQ